MERVKLACTEACAVAFELLEAVQNRVRLEGFVGGKVTLEADAVQVDPAVVDQIVDLAFVVVSRVLVRTDERVEVVDRDIDAVLIGDVFSMFVPVAKNLGLDGICVFALDGFNHRRLMDNFVFDFPLGYVVAVVLMISSM